MVVPPGTWMAIPPSGQIEPIKPCKHGPPIWHLIGSTKCLHSEFKIEQFQRPHLVDDNAGFCYPLSES